MGTPCLCLQAHLGTGLVCHSVLLAHLCLHFWYPGRSWSYLCPSSNHGSRNDQATIAFQPSPTSNSLPLATRLLLCSLCHSTSHVLLASFQTSPCIGACGVWEATSHFLPLFHRLPFGTTFAMDDLQLVSSLPQTTRPFLFDAWFHH